MPEVWPEVIEVLPVVCNVAKEAVEELVPLKASVPVAVGLVNVGLDSVGVVALTTLPEPVSNENKSTPELQEAALLFAVEIHQTRYEPIFVFA